MWYQVFNKKHQLPRDVQSPSSLSAKKRWCLKVNVLPSTKLKHSIIVLLHTLAISYPSKTAIWSSCHWFWRFDPGLSSDPRSADWDERFGPDWSQGLPELNASCETLFARNDGYTVTYKLLCIFPYFSQRNAYCFTMFRKVVGWCWYTYSYEKFLKICEAFPGQGMWIIQRVWGSWRDFFLGWYPSIKGMKDQSTW